MPTLCAPSSTKCAQWSERNNTVGIGPAPAGPFHHILTSSTVMVSPSILPVSVTLWPACALTLS